MTKFRTSTLAALWIAVVATPASLAIYRALGALPPVARLLVAGLAAAVLVLASWPLMHGLRYLGSASRWLLGACLVSGLGLLLISVPRQNSVDSAQVRYSDGARKDAVEPEILRAWGREVRGYGLHPAFGTTPVPDALVATFSSEPQMVTLLFAKPEAVLFKPDGTSQDSDGVSVDVRVIDRDGASSRSLSFLLTQDDFLGGRWIERVVRSDKGIASLSVEVGSGPPGGTVAWDSTLVGFAYSGWRDHAEQLGRAVLAGVGFLMIALFLALNSKAFAPGSRMRQNRVSWPQVLVGSMIAVALALLVYWSQVSTSYVYFWDYRNYWEKTEALYALLIDGSLRQAVELFSATYTSNYSLLPAVGPALLSVLAGSPTRINYALTITALYAVPAFFMVCYLGRKLLGSASIAIDDKFNAGWVWAVLPVVAGLPVFLGTTLYLMPDIGGVVLVVGALMAAASLAEHIREPGADVPPWQVSEGILRASISLGLLLSVMFVFRRWYLFSAVGIACALFAVVLFDLVRQPAGRKALLSRAGASVVLVAVAALPFVCWFAFAWSSDPAQHDYAKLYASYRVSLGQDARVLGNYFGVVVPLLCIAGNIFLYRSGTNRRLLFLLLASTLVAVVLFLLVQSPGRHHYYLLMPLMGAALAGFALFLFGRWGVAGIGGLFLVILVGGWVAGPPQGGTPRVGAFAGFEDIRPRQQAYAAGFAKLSHWLALPENEGKKFCLVASSVAINQGLFRELWQILPNVPRHAYDQRMVRLGQVDSVDGPPWPAVRECELFLVGVPFQAHLQPAQQASLGIIQRELVEGSGIGGFVGRIPTVFPMGDGVEVRAYRTVRPMEPADHEALVSRFLAGESAAP